jgi:hypothetical protein
MKAKVGLTFCQNYVFLYSVHKFFRWLDDVGLPQYKDAFLEARIDAREGTQLLKRLKLRDRKLTKER